MRIISHRPPAMYHVLAGRRESGVIALAFRRSFGTRAEANGFAAALQEDGYLTSIVKVQS